VLGGFASLKECSCFVQTASVPIFLLIRWPSEGIRVSSARSSVVIPGPQFIAAKSEGCRSGLGELLSLRQLLCSLRCLSSCDFPNVLRILAG
jgi:hypothetical protein